MSIQKPIIVMRVSQRSFEARVPAAAYGGEHVPPNRGSFRATGSGEWVHLFVPPIVEKAITQEQPKFCYSRLLATASMLASERASYVWDIDLAIADGCALCALHLYRVCRERIPEKVGLEQHDLSLSCAEEHSV